MKGSPIEPGAQLGVLGGGQLGAMFAAAARRLGYRVAVWDPDPEAPALQLADVPVSGPFDALGLLERFSDVSAVTYEWENIPARLAEALERRVPVSPASRILRLLQNRLDQKQFLADRGFPVAPFLPVRSRTDLQAAHKLGFPCLCKTATAGYDGKGQWLVSSAQDLGRIEGLLAEQPGRGPWVLERFLEFHKELSVLVVRGADGDRRIYPVVENRHDEGILRATWIPADVPSRTAEEAAALGTAVVDALGGVGVFCIELFLMSDSRLLINEVAPRPHNSGHYTLDACTVSQFEQQVRTLCRLPLGEVRLLSPAVMVNILGQEVERVLHGASLLRLLGRPGVCLHLYGKKSARARRKMGHVTLVAEKRHEVEAAADSFLSGLELAVPPTSRS
jgi:5-(carboxyamino)imidazole ribonucleotide synthase